MFPSSLHISGFRVGFLGHSTVTEQMTCTCVCCSSCGVRSSGIGKTVKNNQQTDETAWAELMRGRDFSWLRKTVGGDCGDKRMDLSSYRFQLQEEEVAFVAGCAVPQKSVFLYRLGLSSPPFCSLPSSWVLCWGNLKGLIDCQGYGQSIDCTWWKVPLCGDQKVPCRSRGGFSQS